MVDVANQLLRMDSNADAIYEQALSKREHILREAKAEALRTIQEATQKRGHERETALQDKTRALKTLKESIIEDAKREAQRSKEQARSNQDAAVAAIIDAVMEELAQ